MSLADARHIPLAGALWAASSSFAFSANDMFMKFLSGDYPLHQLIFVRSLVGMALVLGVLMPLAGGWHLIRTRRPGMHALRGLAVVLSNALFFLGLAAMPLAEAVAIFFICPLLISFASVVFLGETVGPRRWAAIAMGFVGVAIVLRPGTEAFQPASLLPVLAACCYAALAILTRKMGPTESAATLIFYVQLSFIVTSGVIGLAFGHGGFAGGADPSLEFLFRGWVVPGARDLAIMAFLGFASAFGGYAIGQAYRLSEAALVAPVEYLAIPLSVFWGWAIFGELPDGVAFAGIALILSGGMILIWREAVARPRQVSLPPRHR